MSYTAREWHDTWPAGQPLFRNNKNDNNNNKDNDDDDDDDGGGGSDDGDALAYSGPVANFSGSCWASARNSFLGLK